MKKVLIALDYDPSAVKVAESGYLLAKAIGAEVVFLHIISDLSIYSEVGLIIIKGFFAGHMNTNTELAKTPIDIENLSLDFLDKLKFHLGNNKIQTIIKESNSNKLILETAEELNVDFIVLGSHSKNWFENGALGTTAHNVLLNASIPLYIVPIKKSYY